jgi:neutral ceramidase
MVIKGWVRWPWIVFVLLATPAATCDRSRRFPVEPLHAVTSSAPSPLRAGVAKTALSLATGTPLAGYGSTKRRRFDIIPGNGFTFFKPATGTLDPPYAKALVMANDSAMIGIVTVDAVGIIGELVDRIHAKATLLGSHVARENLVVSASHTHSGPGSQTSLRFWELAGTDKLFKPLRDAFVNDCAKALVDAETNLAPAKFGTASSLLAGVTKNRRVGVSPNVTPDTVDEELGVIRIDRSDGTPLALLWNFAIHGTVYGDSNLLFSADIMGAVSDAVEKQLNLTALFANGAEGDTAPNGSGAAGIAQLAPQITQKIAVIYSGISTAPQITLQCVSQVEKFGKATLDLSLDRLSPGSTDLDFATLRATALPLGHVVFKMGPKWFENDFRFQAIRMNDTLIVPVPGEPIFVVGKAIKLYGKTLGFSRVFIFGLSNGHMAYITDEAEYNIGGYEAVATFFGPHTADKVRSAAMSQMVLVQP